jgi:hypothetical protein
MSDVTEYPDPQSLITVARFVEPSAAQMAKGALEAAGIPCFLHGEHANEMLALAFGARLQVHPEDEAAALMLLGEDGSMAAAAAELAGEAPETLVPGGTPRDFPLESIQTGEVPVKPDTAVLDDGALVPGRPTTRAMGDTLAGDPADV